MGGAMRAPSRGFPEKSKGDLARNGVHGKGCEVGFGDPAGFVDIRAGTGLARQVTAPHVVHHVVKADAARLVANDVVVYLEDLPRLDFKAGFLHYLAL